MVDVAVIVAVNAGCPQEAFSRSPGPAKPEDGGMKLSATTRENLSPAAGREDEANLLQRFLQEPASERASACTKRQVAATILGHFAEPYERHRYYGASADRKHMAQAQAAHSVMRRAGGARCSLP